MFVVVTSMLVDLQVIKLTSLIILNQWTSCFFNSKDIINADLAFIQRTNKRGKITKYMTCALHKIKPVLLISLLFLVDSK